MLKLVYKGRLLGVNEFINANRIIGELKAHKKPKKFYLGWQTKKAMQDALAAEFVMQAAGKRFDEHCSVYISFYEKDNRRDDDNVTGGAKFVMDALTQAGIIPDDSPKYCHVISERFTLEGDKKERDKNARIEVYVIPDREGRLIVAVTKGQG